MVVSSLEIASHDSFQFFSILDFHIFHIFLKGQLFIFLVNVDCVIDKFFQISIQVDSFIFFLLRLIVYFFYFMIMLLIIRALLSFFFEKFSSHLKFFFVFSPFFQHTCNFSQLSKLFSRLIFFQFSLFSFIFIDYGTNLVCSFFASDGSYISSEVDPFSFKLFHLLFLSVQLF